MWMFVSHTFASAMSSKIGRYSYMTQCHVTTGGVKTSHAWHAYHSILDQVSSWILKQYTTAYLCLVLLRCHVHSCWIATWNFWALFCSSPGAHSWLFGRISKFTGYEPVEPNRDSCSIRQWWWTWRAKRDKQQLIVVKLAQYFFRQQLSSRSR